MGRVGAIYGVANEIIPFFLNPYELALIGFGAFVEDPILDSMADSQIGVGQDGMFVNVRTPGGLPVCTPQVARSVNFGVAFAQASAFIDDPQWYEKPERLLGRGKGPDAEHDGGPGYIPYHRVSFSAEGFRVHTRRPFHPILSSAGRRELATWVNDWIAGGVMGGSVQQTAAHGPSVQATPSQFAGLD